MRKKSDVIRTALEAIRKAHGGVLRPNDVVAAARAKSHPLHGEFIWDDKKAANQSRLDRARDLITRYVTVTIVTRNRRVTAPYYVRDPDAAAHEQGSIPVTDASLTERHAQKIVLAEIERCTVTIERARGIATVLSQRFPGVVEQLERALEALVCAKDDLSEAA